MRSPGLLILLAVMAYADGLFFIPLFLAGAVGWYVLAGCVDTSILRRWLRWVR